MKNSKKSEGERAQMNKILHINKQIRQYDLSRIKEQEVEDLKNNVSRLKNDWQDLKGFLQRQVLTLADVKSRHENEAKEYRNFVEYLEPGSLKEKLENTIKILDREAKRLDKPVDKLRTDLAYQLEVKEQLAQKVEEMRKRNMKLKMEMEKPENQKKSKSEQVMKMREDLAAMREKML